MSDEILRLSADQVREMLKQGEMDIPTIPLIEPQIPGDSMIERAKEVLGKDFMGVEAVRNMESKLKGVGVNVEFVLDNIPLLPYDEQDLQLAKQNGEMLVLRPEEMERDEGKMPLTLMNFRKLFSKNPLGKTGAIFGTNWYTREKFATQAGEIKLGWSLVRKDVLMVRRGVLDGAIFTSWNKQEGLLQQYGEGLKIQGAKNVSVRRRTALEAVYDTLLYYVNTGEKLLLDKYDWGQTKTSVGSYVYLGRFNTGGLRAFRIIPGHSYYSIGVCATR